MLVTYVSFNMHYAPYLNHKMKNVNKCYKLSIVEILIAIMVSCILLNIYAFLAIFIFTVSKMASAQEKAMMGTTLACLLPSLRNKRTTVELRNESFVTGRVVQTDGFMNITMEDVTFTDALGNKTKFECFFVQSRLIR